MEAIMTLTKTVAWTLAIMLGAGAPGAWAYEDDAPRGAPREKLGEVNFPVSCNAAAQKEFNRAMALFHSFWFDPAIKSFSKVLQHDPECGMAHWGIAIMSVGNPLTWPPNPKAFKAGATAMADAQRVGAKSERERDYIAALAAFFKDWETTDHRPRAVAFERAIEDVAARYPQDTEAQILYALVLNATALPTDKTFANQLKAASILEPLFKKYPNHPGVAHYLIHTYDYAELAEKGLPAARAYARIAPSVPHALHMPSHIFSRLGLWREMVESNRASYLAAKSELKETTLGIGTYDALHAMDYMVFAHLQQAQDQVAKQVVDEGRIGRPFHYRAQYLQDWTISPDLPLGGQTLWRLDADVAGAGVTGDLLSHSIDTAMWLNGCHQALNMATARRLRISGEASVKVRIFSPSSQPSVRSRRVDSSGHREGTRTSGTSASARWYSRTCLASRS
jgi:hypothetical protein